MKKMLCRCLIYVCLFQLVAQPVLANDYRVGNDARAGDASSGMSFRKTDITSLNDVNRPQLPEQQMLSKGSMASDSIMSTLTYQVHILGEVKKPGTYKITASDRLSEVVTRAGGINENGSVRNIEIRRQGEPLQRIDLMKFQLLGNLEDNPYLLDNDVVLVPLKSSVVQVVGAVKRPREYELKNEKTLSDVLKLAGGVSVGAALASPIRVVRFVNEKKEVVEVETSETAMQSFVVLNGDTIFVPHVITEKNKFDYDIPKLPGDNIFYPSFEDRVFILGGVNQPGAYEFNPYYTLPQYLSLAGGLTQLATSRITVLSPDGTNKKISKKNRATFIINPGDTVVVDQHRIPPEGWVSLVMGIATFGLSTTATVLALKRY